MERLVDDTGKPRDARVMPRVYQQVDWSNGGDGIVVRADIKEVKDLRGKTIVLAQNSPSHYFALNMLVAAGVQPDEVTFRFTNTAFEAARASRRDISAVSLKPTPNRARNKLLNNRRFRTCGWADFARDHAKIEAIVRSIFDSMERSRAAKSEVPS
jgi:hypothetical protein